MTNKENKTEQMNDPFTTLREVVETMDECRAKMYAEMQLEDYDSATSESQRAKILSNLRAGLKQRAENDESYAPLFDALPQRTRSTDPQKEAYENGILAQWVEVFAGHEELVSSVERRKGKNVPAGSMHTVQTMAEYMTYLTMKTRPYEKEAQQ